MTRALIFPGQGSQSVGMGRELAEASASARAVFEEVDDALGETLSRLIFEGDVAELTLTQNAQPALMAVSLAALRVLTERSGRDLTELATCVAGHSLGEYSALTAAGAIEIGDAARLLRKRGQAMQQAAPVGIGAMAALSGFDFEMAQQIAFEAAQGEVCAAANDNAPGQVVVSGHRGAVERAVSLAAARGGRRSILLPVSAPFHSPLMRPAHRVMAEALAGVKVRVPLVPLIANVTASMVTDPAAIRDLLVRQVTGTVRWRESVLHMKAYGVVELVELGAGKVLSGLARHIDKGLKAVSLGTPTDIDGFVASLA